MLKCQVRSNMNTRDKNVKCGYKKNTTFTSKQISLYDGTRAYDHTRFCQDYGFWLMSQSLHTHTHSRVIQAQLCIEREILCIHTVFPSSQSWTPLQSRHIHWTHERHAAHTTRHIGTRIDSCIINRQHTDSIFMIHTVSVGFFPPSLQPQWSTQYFWW